MTRKYRIEGACYHGLLSPLRLSPAIRVLATALATLTALTAARRVETTQSASTYTLINADGRRTLMDDRLIVRAAGERVERRVTNDEWPVLLDELFGVRDALT